MGVFVGFLIMMRVDEHEVADINVGQNVEGYLLRCRDQARRRFIAWKRENDSKVFFIAMKKVAHADTQVTR